jgi:hypothetical protein
MADDDGFKIVFEPRSEGEGAGKGSGAEEAAPPVFKVGLAPTDRASCKGGKRCLAPKIAKGELRVTKEQNAEVAGGHAMASHYHAACFFGFVAPRARKWAVAALEELEGHEALSAAHKDEVRALIKRGAVAAEPKADEGAEGGAEAGAAKPKKKPSKKRAQADAGAGAGEGGGGGGGEDDGGDAPSSAPAPAAKKPKASSSSSSSASAAPAADDIDDEAYLECPEGLANKVRLRSTCWKAPARPLPRRRTIRL